MTGPYLTWIPPNGAGPIDLASEDGPFVVAAPGPVGLIDTLAELVEDSTIGQWGTTPLGTTVNRRTVPVAIHILGDDESHVWNLREQFAAAMASRPSRVGVKPSLGLLQLHRPGMPLVEVDATPVAVRGGAFTSETSVKVDVDFVVPDPRWRRPGWETVTLEQGGGFFGPFHGPFYSLGANVSLVVFNSGTAPAPIVARIYGVLDTPRLILVGTGEALEISGGIAGGGEHLLVDTSAVNRRVQLVETDGTVSDASRRLNRAISDFWEIPPGFSTVRLEADDNPSGRAVISWQPRLAGV